MHNVNKTMWTYVLAVYVILDVATTTAAFYLTMTVEGVSMTEWSPITHNVFFWIQTQSGLSGLPQSLVIVSVLVAVSVALIKLSVLAFGYYSSKIIKSRTGWNTIEHVTVTVAALTGTIVVVGNFVELLGLVL